MLTLKAKCFIGKSFRCENRWIKIDLLEAKASWLSRSDIGPFSDVIQVRQSRRAAHVRM